MNRLLWISFLLAGTVVGCRHAPPKQEVVWPKPPEKARIRFVRAFAQSDDLDRSGFAKFRQAVFGGGIDPRLAQPMGAAVSDDGKRLYIASYGRGAIMVANFEVNRMQIFAPDEPVGKVFNVALDGSENVYASSSSARVVRVFDRSGKPLRDIGNNQLERPTGLAIDRERSLLYVSDSSSKDSPNHRVRVFDLEGKWLRDVGVEPGQPTKGQEDGQFYFPCYLALDSNGNLFVGDNMNFRIQVFSPEGKFLKKFGENGTGPGTFPSLKGLAFDGFGNLYVADGRHSVVQMFNERLEPLMYFGGYAKKLEYFDIPSCIAIEPKTNLIYVCNEFISRINVYELINTTKEDSLMTVPANAPGESSTR